MATVSTASRLSFLTAAAGFVALGGLGFHQLWKDGSFWLDEASLALSLLELTPLESFGPLVGGQSFPRLYLLAIHGMVGLLGYETMVVRGLPHLFFLAGTFAWLGLLRERFPSEALWVALGVLLLAVPGTWLFYGAMFKSYSLDVFASTIPFLLRDAFYDDTLERGERSWRLVALASLGVVSYPFALVLLARIGGWWLQRAANGRWRVAPRPAALGIAGVAVFAAWIWRMELSYTRELGEALREFWGACLIGSGEVGTLALLDRFVFGWFDGRADFAQAKLAAPTLIVLKIAFVAGLARIGLALVPGFGPPKSDGWGSRSLGYATLLTGLPLASALLDYPICAGRLTLFALLPIVVILLEGVDGAASLLRRTRAGGWTALLAGAALGLAILPTSYANLTVIAAGRPPEDLRPLLEETLERPDLPILTTTCTRRQIETLPEGIPAQVFYIQEGGGIAIAMSEQRSAWLLFVPAHFCRGGITKVRELTTLWEPHHPDDDGPRLIRIGFPKP